MNTARAFTMSLLLVITAGCAHHEQPLPSNAKSWPHHLSDEETVRCKEVAWAAANSPEMWERFKLKRRATEPIKLSDKGIQFDLDQKQFDRVDVVIPSGGWVGWHPTYISVTVARGTFEVLGMHESFWP